MNVALFGVKILKIGSTKQPPMLHSFIGDNTGWPPGKWKVAKHYAPLSSWPDDHIAPEHDCQCGFYTVYQKENLYSHWFPGTVAVLMQIRPKIMRHNIGMRSQHACLVGIIMLSKDEYLSLKLRNGMGWSSVLWPTAYEDYLFSLGPILEVYQPFLQYRGLELSAALQLAQDTDEVLKSVQVPIVSDNVI